jgi:hypothetical protein
MPDFSGIQVLVEGAERAAAVGDWPSAEEGLRRVADLQAAQLGQGHTDLAYTLNNLGVACERTGKPDEAEQCYRRAHAIAAAALPADDPLVVTSRQNFRELCASRGTPVDLTPSPPPPTPSIEARVESEPPSTATVEVQSRSHPLATGIAAVVGVAIAVLTGWYFWSGSGQSVQSVESQEVVETGVPPVPTPAGPATPATESPNIAESRPSAALKPAPARPVPVKPAPPKPAPPKPALASAPVSVVEAQLCSALSTTNWRCTPASPSTGPGSLYFYTRLQSPVATKVEHRWYYEERLVQTVTLDIGANQGPGYRTYSRHTIRAERAGNWRVELRSPDGTVLNEERFVIRQ